MEPLYIPCRYDYYCRVLECFYEYSTVNTEDKSWLRCRITDLLSHINKDTTIKVLSVGSGTGSKDLIILKSLSKVFPKIQYDIVEPVEQHVKMFERNVVHHPGMEHIEFKLNCMTFGEFMKNKYEVEYYHLVHAIHVLYYGDAVQWIRSISNILLQPKGLCVIILNSQESRLTNIRKQLSKIHPGVVNLNQVQNVNQVLEDLGVTYNCESILAQTNVSAVFEDDEIGELLLDMITCIYKFKHFAPVAVQEAVMDLLKQICSKENNKHILHLSSDVFIIRQHLK